MRFRRCRITVPRWVAELALRVGPVTDHRLGFRRQLPVGPRLPKSGAAASRGAVFGTTNSGANRSRRKQVTLSGPIEVSGRSKRVWFFWGALFFSIVSYSVDGLRASAKKVSRLSLANSLISHVPCWASAAENRLTSQQLSGLIRLRRHPTRKAAGVKVF
jgi:hypothetical protein